MISHDGRSAYDEKLSSNKIVTQGDAKVNVVNTLSDLSMVTTEMPSTVGHLKEYVIEELDDGPKNSF